jgi:hypothetical protein
VAQRAQIWIENSKSSMKPAQSEEIRKKKKKKKKREDEERERESLSYSAHRSHTDRYDTTDV